jgi:MtN3 and saliva related transmembrane protein
MSGTELQLEIIGFTGGALIIISLIPQLFVIILNKSSKDVSIYMYFILLLAQILWSIYGFIKNDLQVIITNIIAAFLTILIISFSLYYKIRPIHNVNHIF